jgi:dTDP-4-dehydrorhamnose 3,5-epimerase
MKIIKTTLKDLYIIEPQVFEDERGFFMETYNKARFEENGLKISFVQDNHSKSKKGTLRGLHYQTEPYAQAKLVRVIKGAIFDVAVDLRKEMPTYLQWFGIELSASNRKQMLIPRGFGHGFYVLENETEVCYKCDNLYHKDAERTIKWDDPSINIKWPISKEWPLLISDKDKQASIFHS